ncbi:MAG TPA: hypothetical protein ENG87_01300 [Candidatus Pacearchaeota archaeon]|nr:bifunctional aspartokinase/homoserine dehydrogenase 1 [archaeon BMS3Abin17]HDK41987.1 hypothetical protein [Candidatus Pacearchaeota archaeon]HDZ61480.1 hypothetical protein [Candidatus Pacearchaeota archaeon]
MIQNVFIIGATGKVGRELVSQIVEKDLDNKKHINPTRIIGLASSSNFLFSEKGLSKENCLDFSERKRNFEKYGSLDELLEMVKSIKRDEGDSFVLIDVTAVKNIIDFHLKIIRETDFGIVTANKNPLALSDYKTFQELIKEPSRYGYRCSVMAGAGVIDYIQDLRDVTDHLELTEGCFSGTIGFILSELENSVEFSEALKKAIGKGYTEPHPRDDLNGLDVAKKLLILARTSGYNVNMKDIRLLPLIPEKYFNYDKINEFLDSVKELDNIFLEKIIKAKESGNVLRYIARISFENNLPKLSISLREVPKNSPLGSLKGTLNKIHIVSGAGTYSVKAPGAGLKITAQNIRRDLLQQLKGRKLIEY